MTAGTPRPARRRGDTAADLAARMRRTVTGPPPPAPPATREPEQAPPAGADRGGQVQPDAAPAPPAPEPRRRGRPPLPEGTPRPARLNVTMPERLAARLRRHAGAHGVTLATVVLRAYAAHWRDLAAGPEPEPAPPADPLDLPPPPPGRQSRAQTSRVQLWLTDEERSRLEAAVAAGLAPSLSALVTAVTERALPARR